MVEEVFGGLAGAVVHTIREPLLILDADLRIREANPAFYRSFVAEPEETLGQPLFEIGNRQWDIPAFRQLLEEVLPENSAVEDFEVEHEFPTVGSRHLLLNARRLEEAGEDLILLAIHDVTDQRELEQDLQRSNQELERFAYVASHDLQEPLRMVASYTRLLARRYEGKLDERADKYIRYAVEGAERMKALIQDLLEYSRVGTQGGDPMPTDPGEVLQDVIQDLRMSIKQTGARVTHAALPRVFVDQAQLRQLFQNLLGNALKFSGDSPPVIEVSGRREGDQAVISFRDEGIGIEPKYFDQIFVVFKRLHGRDTAGTGIGLALCRRIVDRHGGQLWVESEPGVGSTFFFTLPSAEET